VENRILAIKGTITFDTKSGKGFKSSILFLNNQRRMFKKKVIAEDLDSISIAVVQALESLSIEVIQHSKYCDDAFYK
jgi:hypothetical protein